jgi:hypothetical protein
MLEVTMQDTIKPNGFDQTDCPYPAGATIEQSGLYEICHYDEPRTRVVLVLNGVFPFCRRCGDKVRYKLVQAVPHISEDPDFNEFLEEPYNPAIDSASPNHALPVQLGLAYGFRFCQEPIQTWRPGPESGDL